MEEQEFNLDEFRNQLLQLETELTSGIKQDGEYQGELDEVIASLGRLKIELKDNKYQQILPDIFNVLQFLNMVEENFDEDEEEYEDEEEFDIEEEDEEEK